MSSRSAAEKIVVNVPRQRGGLLRSAFIAALLVGVGVYAANHFPTLNPFSTKTVDRSPAPILKAIQRVSEFHAARAQLQQVVDIEHDVAHLPSFVAGSHETMVVQGSVDAVVDLGGVGPKAITLSKDGRTATVTVPAPHLAKPQIDLKASRVVSRDRGIVNRVGDALGDESGDRTLLLRAQSKLQAAADSDRAVIQTAQANTRAMLTRLLSGRGVTHVNVRFAQPAL